METMEIKEDFPRYKIMATQNVKSKSPSKIKLDSMIRIGLTHLN